MLGGKKENTVLVHSHNSVCKMREAHIPFHSVLMSSKSSITLRKEEKQSGDSSNERKEMRGVEQLARKERQK